MPEQTHHGVSSAAESPLQQDVTSGCDVAAVYSSAGCSEVKKGFFRSHQVRVASLLMRNETSGLSPAPCTGRSGFQNPSGTGTINHPVGLQ
ncbi:hypothetical protein NQZ68_017257 [Dissostichus eleginoides]|nr:hypothetical protein NQZ68_017257 [Dissostichus eleginoides]